MSDNMLSYVGGDSIVGADSATIAEIIGAASQAVLERVAAARAAGGVAVVSREGNAKVKVLPFSTSASLAAAASATVTVTAQEMYRPTRLVLSDAASWAITSIRITTKEQLAASGSFPGAAFANTAWGVHVDFDTIPVGGQAAMGVTNISGGALVLYSGFIGNSIG